MRPFRRWRVALFLAGLVAGLGVFAFLNAASFLERPAQKAVRSDAVLVLGGGFGDRERRAAELFREGVSDTFMLMGMEDSVNDKQIDYLHWRSRVLARQKGWKRVTVLSDPPHVRRLRMVYGRAFEGTGAEFVVVASRPAWWVPERWWSNGKCAQFVVMEYIKLAYTVVYPVRVPGT